MKKKITLPDQNRDIVLIIRRKNTLRIIATAVWYAVMITGLSISLPLYARQTADINPAFWFFVALLSLIPLFLFRLNRIFDSAWSGQIIAKKDEERSSSPFYDGADDMNRVINLEILTDTGDYIECHFSKKRYEIGDKYYNIGDRVTHYSGTEFLYNHNKVENDNRICVMCGHVTEGIRCPRCGASIIKQTDNKQ